MKQPKGLGRGLDAIFGAEKVEVKVKPMNEMAQIALSDIIANPTQPRSDFNEDALDELANSVRSLGVIQPITVKKLGDQYMIVSGERRWKAAKIAGLKSIPAYVREVNDENLHAMALVENIQRQDLNPIEIALCMQRLIEEFKLTQDALSEKVGVKRSSVSNYLRLLKLPDAIQFALKGGVITMGHAKAIAGVDEPKKQLWLMKTCVAKSLSVRQTEELARSLQVEKPQKPETTEEEYPDSYLRLVEQLEGYFSQNISIKKSKNGGGKIVIEFNDDQEIDTFISRFNQ